MKPQLLKFSGIRSYRRETSVDFTSLDLFAIIGDTGAGKSTILEALTFALYGRKTWSGQKAEELIADGEKKLVVEFTFAAEGDSWTVTRTRNRTTTPGIDKLVSAAGAKIDGSRAVTEKVTELLGLNIDQFTRAVLMPQGRFDELLKASGTERTRILTSILGLDELKLVRARAERLLNQWREPVVGATTERNLLPRDPDDHYAGLQSQAATELANLTRLEAALGEAKLLESDVTRLATSKDALDLELGRLPALDDDGYLTQLTQLASVGAALLDEHLEATQAVKQANDEETAVAAEQTNVLQGLAGRDAVVSTIANLRHTGETFTVASEGLEAASTKLLEHAKLAPPADIPAQLRDASTAANRVQETRDADAQGATRRFEDAVRAWQLLEDAHTSHRQALAVLDDATATRTAAQNACDAANARAAEVEGRAETADAAYQAAMRADAAAAAATHSHPGEDCPVCSRTLPASFQPPAAPNLAAAKSTLDETRAEHQQALQVRSDANAASTQAELAVTAAQAGVDAAATTVASCRTTCLDLGVDPEAATRDAALGALEQAQTDARLQAQQAAAANAAAATAVTDAEAALRERRQAHELIGQQLEGTKSGFATQLQTCTSAVDLVPDAWRPASPLTPAAFTDAVSRLGKLRVDLDQLERRRTEAHDKAEAARSKLADLRTRGSEMVQQPARDVVTAINRRLERITDVSNAATAVASVLSLDGPAPPAGPLTAEVKASNLPAIHEAAAETLASARECESLSRRLLDEAVERHQQRSDSLAGILATAGQTDVGQLQTATGEVRQREQLARVAEAAGAADRDRAHALQKFLEIGRPFIENLEAVTEALQESRFVRHLVQARETELLAEATRRLKSITNGRFGFVADFGVANLASGEIRTPEALSGGERFQAALALALALVEIASRGGGRLDAVFVDEGFGSLDSKALDVALETLASVAGGGKTVALISHLRPVAEYVETVLHVTRNDVLGSRIDRLDPDERDKLLADDIRSGLTA